MCNRREVSSCSGRACSQTACRLTASHEGCTFPIESHRDPYVVRGVIASWLAQHGLTVEEVKSIQFWLHPGKPFAHEYLDDRAVRFEGTYPQRDPQPRQDQT